MTDAELRDAAARAAMAAMGAAPSVDPFVLQEERRGGDDSAGHHGMLSDTSVPGRFALVPSEDGYGLSNPYYDVGGRTFEASTGSVDVPETGDCVVALKVNVAGKSPTGSVVTYSGVEELMTEQADVGNVDYYITPLYLFRDGALACDFRTGPHVSGIDFDPS